MSLENIVKEVSGNTLEEKEGFEEECCKDMSTLQKELLQDEGGDPEKLKRLRQATEVWKEARMRKEFSKE